MVTVKNEKKTISGSFSKLTIKTQLSFRSTVPTVGFDLSKQTPISRGSS